MSERNKAIKAMERTGLVRVIRLLHVTTDNCEEVYFYEIEVAGMTIKDIAYIKKNEAYEIEKAVIESAKLEVECLIREEIEGNGKL